MKLVLGALAIIVVLAWLIVRIGKVIVDSNNQSKEVGAKKEPEREIPWPMSCPYRGNCLTDCCARSTCPYWCY